MTNPTPPPALWKLIVAQLDATQFDYSSCEIAALLGNDAWAVRYWSRRLFPEKRDPESAYFSHRFDFTEAVLLIQKICKNGRGLPDPFFLYNDLVDRRIICPGAIDTHPAVFEADKVLKRHRATRFQTLSPFNPQNASSAFASS